ncbi:MAG: hypothetical protein RL885_08750 [Planctomycetota bacterium]
MIALSKRFVCTADEVWRLQRGSEADCIFFQKMVNGGKRITDRGSRQGTWICAPSGKVLARTGSRDVEKFLEAMESGLARWDELPPEDKRIPEGTDLTPKHRWEMNYPDGGLALERIVRELSPEGLAAEPAERWSRDMAWFTREEVASWIPSDVTEGMTFELPMFAKRLARFHLVDNARGQTLPYADTEIEAATLQAEVTSRDGQRIALKLAGTTRAEAGGPWALGQNLWKPSRDLPHAIRCDLVGQATFDLEARRFVQFELVSVGRRQGRTQMNGRGRDERESSLLAFHLELAPESMRIAPTFIGVYDADWVLAPAVPTWLESPEECGLQSNGR